MVELPPAGMEDYVVFGYHVLVGELPLEIRRAGRERFEELWALHPPEPPLLRQPFTGNLIPAPRWQQSYRQAYAFSGVVGTAVDLPAILEPYFDWPRTAIDPRLNGLTVNWYDARLGHYIGHHRDYRDGLVEGTPIVTMSLGATRHFRLRPFKGRGRKDFVAQHGSVFILPWDTNLHVYHEVPRVATDQGRRISITARAFRAA